jgi:hypothetical protein
VSWLACACAVPNYTDPSGAGAGGTANGGTGGTGEVIVPITPAPEGRVSRLSHEQWENTVRDLLALDDVSGLSSVFPVQAHSAGYVFDNPADSLQVDQVLSGSYAGAAASLAQTVTSDAARLARILPPGAGDDTARARAFVESFGARAFRRPLAVEEIDAYVAMFAVGQTAYDDVTGFTAGIRLLLEALLQSPHFLYRIETSTAVEGDVVALSDWEVAQRLSYFLTNSMPDDELFRAAREERLTERADIREQAARLLDKPGARSALAHFHDQLLELHRYSGISPSPSRYPDVSPGFGESALAAARAFLDDHVFEQRQGFSSMMTTTRAFANADLAAAYGLDGDFGAGLVPVELPESERRGVFTQLGFLAANATGLSPDPIHRGVFLAKRMLCRAISAPPDNVTPIPPTGEGTNRQVVEDHTESQDGCAGCHKRMINPYGFVFENYDAIGAYRTMDNGLPVDASASPLIDAEEVPVGGALEFADALAESREAHECFVRHLLEYSRGRQHTEADQGMIDALRRASLDDQPIKDLILTLAESDSFIKRSTEELP